MPWSGVHAQEPPGKLAGKKNDMALKSCLKSTYLEQYHRTHLAPPGVARDSFSKSLLSQVVEPGFHGLPRYAWHCLFGPSGTPLAVGWGADVPDGLISRAPAMGDADARADPVTSTLGGDAEVAFTGGAPNATWAAFWIGPGRDPA